MPSSEGPPKPGLGQKAVSSAVYLGATQAARMVLTILSTIVIARLLLPADYGLIAMVSPVVNLVLIFQELGLSAATIQKQRISTEQSNALFWINLITSATIALLLVALAPVVAWFYGDVRAGYVTAASALTVLVSGFAMQHSALLNREMRFGAISAIEVVNALVTFLVAAAAAWWLRSYWALFLGTFAGAAVQTLLMWRINPWRPSWRPGLGHAGGFARFGGHVTGFNLLNYLVRNIDAVLIARFAGAGALGLYDRSYKLMMMPIQNLNAPVARLLMPMLSRLQDDPARYRAAYLLAIWAVMLAIVPPIAIGTAHSTALMVMLLGDPWAAAGPIFFWLGLTGLIQPIPNLTGVLFMSRGETALMLRWGVLSAVITLAGFAIGLRWGAEGLAASLFITMALRIPILFAWCTRGSPVRPFDLYQPQLLPLAGAALAVAVSWPLASRLPPFSFFVVATALAYVCSIAVALLSPAGRDTLAHLAAIALGLLGRVRRRGVAA